MKLTEHPEVDKLIDIWNASGENPKQYERQKNRLAREWPMLYIAITDMITQATGKRAS